MRVRNWLLAGLTMFTLSFVACDDDDNKSNEPEVEPVSFEVAVSEIGTAGAKVTVTPSDANATYYFGVVEKSLFTELGSPAAVAEKMVADLKTAQEAEGATLADGLFQGEASRLYEDELMASTEYSACAFGVDATGKVTSDVFTQDFTTQELPPLVIEGLEECTADFWGDKDGTVNGKWVLTLNSSDYIKYMTLEVATAVDQKENPVGVYEIRNPYGEVGTANPGYINGDMFEGCSYVEYVSFPAVPVLLVSGTITVTSTGEDVYKIDVQAKDDSGRGVQAVYEGELDITDKTLAYE